MNVVFTSASNLSGAATVGENQHQKMNLHKPTRTALQSQIQQLSNLAGNLRWSWHTPSRNLLATLPGAAPGRHPADVVRSADDGELAEWITAHDSELATIHDELDAVIASVGSPEIAYFSPEFGIAAEVPQYSGGLGILAGDHLKSASDIHLPLVGVGLFYREGFFRQKIGAGRQREQYPKVDPDSIAAEDTGKRVVVEIAGAPVTIRVRKQMVGATPLILLDTNVAGNTGPARAITNRLYSGDRRHRLEQELVLGVGGVRALRALGMNPGAFHLNEGHACFMLLELLGERVDAGEPIAAAIDALRAQSLFTTHTPVPAGIDAFSRKAIEPEMRPWARRLGIPLATLMSWSEMPAKGRAKPFNTAALALELCGRANGVSQLHAGVSRKLFSAIPRARSIEGITNGVHARTWVSPAIQDLYDRSLGDGWDNGSPAAWERVDRIDGEEFADRRAAGRRDLVELISARTGVEFDGDSCVIGFARRFATYKRAALLLEDPHGLEATLDSGAQFVFAGKAHPADDEGKAVLAEIVKFSKSREARGRFAFIPDYEISIAQVMYAGCDVWLNNPIRPHEACGTSGEKSALNGGLNCSILDGWWADWFVPGIGWAIPTSDDADPIARDHSESAAMHGIIAGEILPRFVDRDSWWQTTSAMLRHLGPKVTAGRMVAEYDSRYYRQLRGK